MYWLFSSAQWKCLGLCLYPTRLFLLHRGKSTTIVAWSAYSWILSGEESSDANDFVEDDSDNGEVDNVEEEIHDRVRKMQDRIAIDNTYYEELRTEMIFP